MRWPRRRQPQNGESPGGTSPLGGGEPGAPAEEDGAAVTLLSRSTRTAPGRVVGAAMRGLGEAMYGPRDDDPVVVAEAPGAPPNPGFRVELGDGPEDCRITVYRDGDPPDPPA